MIIILSLFRKWFFFSIEKFLLTLKSTKDLENKPHREQVQLLISLWEKKKKSHGGYSSVTSCVSFLPSSDKALEQKERGGGRRASEGGETPEHWCVITAPTPSPLHAKTPLHHHDSTSPSIPLSASLLPFEAITAETFLEEKTKQEKSPKQERTQREKVALLSE